MSNNDRASLYRKARRHLSRRDPVLKKVLGSVGPCTLQVSPGSFIVLVRSIVSQLISTPAARTIYCRIESAVGEVGVNPESLLALGEERLRGVGLSGAKARSLLDLAGRTQDGRLPLDHLAELTDDDAIARLVEVRGIGVWTAEMYLIFCLGRSDVLPVGDLGLRAGVRDCYGLEDLPRPRELRALAEPWRPYRSIATWYLWRSRGFVPQSGKQETPAPGE
jgi:DNA-3-methyladenine glycosylase II